MLDTLGIVEIHLGDESRQTAEQVYNRVTRRLGEQTLLSWIVRRVTEAQQLDGVIGLIGDEELADRLARHVPADVPVFARCCADGLALYNAALDHYPARSIVCVSIDAPFVDPALIDRLVITAQESSRADYIGYQIGGGQAACQSAVGVFAEYCRAKAIRKANQQATDCFDRAEATRYIYSHPDRFKSLFLDAPAALDRDDVRLKVSHSDDWEHTQAIYDALGPESLDWQAIARLLDEQPALRRNMARMNREDVLT